jgi:Translation elongation factor Ts
MEKNLELVEKLVEKTGLSYTEAKVALENADWDILEAIINLERDGKVMGASSYSTNSEEPPKSKAAPEKEEKKNARAEECKKTTLSVLTWLRTVFDKGNANSIELQKDGERMFGMPVNLFVILACISFGTVFILMVISLFFGVRYRFAGPDLGKDSINRAMGKATDVVDSIKKDIKNAAAEESKE